MSSLRAEPPGPSRCEPAWRRCPTRRTSWRCTTRPGPWPGPRSGRQSWPPSLAGADGAVPATAVTDTVKEVGPGGHLVTLDRSRLVAVQTPQAFRAEILRRAHLAGTDASDDAALVEAAGGRIVLVDGPAANLKVTSPLDLVVAAALAAVVAP